MSGRKVLFFLLLVFCLTPYAFPPLLFAAGSVFSMISENPFPNLTKKLGEKIFKISVIFFGFGINFQYLTNALNLGYFIIIPCIVLPLTFCFPIFLLPSKNRAAYFLISAALASGGTKTVGEISRFADKEKTDLKTAFSIIFLFSSAAVFIFPITGYFLNLSVYQYAVWTAAAIPDTLFALNTAAVFGAESLLIVSANSVVRFLFFVPLLFIFNGLFENENPDKHGKPFFSEFLFLFFAAVVIRNYAPVIVPISFYDSFVNLAKAGFAVTLFLAGIEFSRQTLKDIRIKPLIFGLLLWSLPAISSLIYVIYSVK